MPIFIIQKKDRLNGLSGAFIGGWINDKRDTTMIKLEQKFLTAFRREWRLQNPGGFFFKIPDSPTAKQISKPFDAFGVYCGVSAAFEAKSMKGAAPLKLSDLRQSQIDGLTLARKNLWLTWVLAYYHDTWEFMCVPFDKLFEKGSVAKGEYQLTKIKI